MLDNEVNNYVSDQGKDNKLDPIGVDLGRMAKQQDGRLKGHKERYGRRNDFQSSIAHDELSDRSLSTSCQRMVDPDTQRDCKKSGQDQVVRPMQMRLHCLDLQSLRKMLLAKQEASYDRLMEIEIN